MRRFAPALSICLLLVLSACGSTTRQSRTDGDVRSEVSDVARPGASGSATPAGTGSSDPTAAATAAGGDASAGTSTPVKSSGGTGRGVTPTTINIGFATASGEGSLAGSLGIEGGGTVSSQAIMDAVIDDVNAAGGVLGRKLAIRLHTFDAVAAVGNPQQTFSAVCADYRDDREVFAVMFDQTDPTLRNCMAAMGSPLLVLGGGIVPAAAYNEHGGNYLYAVNATTNERLATLFIQSLMARNFVQRWNTTTGAPGSAPVKLGLIHVDTPDQNAYYATYAKELAKHGLKFAEVVTYPQNLVDALGTTNGSILRFKTAGVTHMFGASAFFLQGAESQGYRPRYAYIPGLGAFGVKNVPPEQMRGALTVGSMPAKDVEAAQDPGTTPGAKRCRGVMQARGLNMSNRLDLSSAYSVCDGVYSLVAALKAGGEPTVAGLRRGYESLGSRFATAQSFAASFGPGRHYGNDSVRDIAFDTPCGCLKYTSKTNRS